MFMSQYPEHIGHLADIRQLVSPIINEIGVQAFARDAAQTGIKIDDTLALVRVHVVDQLGLIK